MDHFKHVSSISRVFAGYDITLLHCLELSDTEVLEVSDGSRTDDKFSCSFGCSFSYVYVWL